VILESFERTLQNGPITIGQVLVNRTSAGRFELHHRDEPIDRPEIRQIFFAPQQARQIARFDAQGVYRPLKGAPTLVTGWLLRLETASEALEALDYLYPGAFATWLRFEKHQVNSVPLRETLRRQSGMYRVARKATREQADQLIGRFCSSTGGCLRTILWQIEPGVTISTLPGSKFDPAADQAGQQTHTTPFLCIEACNLLVAELRKVVKAADQ
jgi:sirohydrochlorin cobaltochelatase